SPAPATIMDPLLLLAGAVLIGVVLLVSFFLKPYLDWRSTCNQSLESQVARTSFQYAPGELVPPAWKAPEVTLSVIVPAYNEEYRLPQMLDETLTYLESRGGSSAFSYEVIVVDDGSSDATYTAALGSSSSRQPALSLGEVRVIKLAANRGKGFAVRAGMLAARGQLLLMADGDGATSIRDLERLERALGPVGEEKAPEIAFGSRHHLREEAIAARAWHRNLLMMGFQFAVWFLVGGSVNDTQCGFKLFRAGAAASGRKADFRFAPPLQATWGYPAAAEAFNAWLLEELSYCEAPVWPPLPGRDDGPWPSSRSEAVTTWVLLVLPCSWPTTSSKDPVAQAQRYAQALKAPLLPHWPGLPTAAAADAADAALGEALRDFADEMQWNRSADEAPLLASVRSADALRTEVLARLRPLAASVIESRVAAFLLEVRGLSAEVRRRWAAEATEAASSLSVASSESGASNSSGKALPDASKVRIELLGALPPALEGRMPRRHDVHATHVEKLRRFFVAAKGAEGGEDISFEVRCWVLLMRYKALFGPHDEGAGWHMALTRPVFACLQEVFGVEQELFASPLNCTLPRFCSVFPDTDVYFGSQGGFFGFCRGTLAKLGGNYECNPPFEEGLMQRVVAALLQALAELDTATSGAGVAVSASVALVLPTWAASQALKAATEASFCRAVLQVSGAEHCYLNGRQHCCQPKHRLLRQSEARGSSIIFLQNEAGAERWPATPERLDRLRAAWVEGGSEGGADDREVPEGRRRPSAGKRQLPEAEALESEPSSAQLNLLTGAITMLRDMALVQAMYWWCSPSSSSPRSPYEVLGIEKGAAAADVKRAYRKQALKWHPDKCELDRAECEARFIEVAGAYEVLGDEAKRRSFDATGQRQSSTSTGSSPDDLKRAQQMFNSFFENFEAALSDDEKLDAYVQQAFEMFGASSGDKDTKDSWSVWGLKKAMKWGVKSFGQSVLEGSFAARPIHCVRLRAECCNFTQRIPTDRRGIRNGDIQISLKDDSGQSGPAGPAGKVHGNGKKSQLVGVSGLVAELGLGGGRTALASDTTVRKTIMIAFPCKPAWLCNTREKGKRKRSVCLAWISMASAFFSLIDSLGETFEEAVGNVEDSLGNFEKEFDGALQQMDAGVDLDDVLEEIEVAGSNEVALLEAYRRLEVLARNQSPAVMQAWVVEDRVVPVVCAALCRVESARLAAGALARTLNGMGHALDITGASPEDTSNDWLEALATIGMADALATAQWAKCVMMLKNDNAQLRDKVSQLESQLADTQSLLQERRQLESSLAQLAVAAGPPGLVVAPKRHVLCNMLLSGVAAGGGAPLRPPPGLEIPPPSSSMGSTRTCCTLEEEGEEEEEDVLHPPWQTVPWWSTAPSSKRSTGSSELELDEASGLERSWSGAAAMHTCEWTIKHISSKFKTSCGFPLISPVFTSGVGPLCDFRLMLVPGKRWADADKGRKAKMDRASHGPPNGALQIKSQTAASCDKVRFYICAGSAKQGPIVCSFAEQGVQSVELEMDWQEQVARGCRPQPENYDTLAKKKLPCYANQCQHITREFREFCQQIVRRTENGKAMLKLMQAQDVSSQTQGLALLRRVYPHTSAVLGRHLLSDPAAVGALMQILQDASGSAWSADGDGKGESADSQMGLASLCAECVQFLSLVTAQDGDVRMIVTFQDGAEALLAIAAQALSAANAAGTGPESSSSAERSRAFLGTAAGACACVRNLVGQGSVAQKYMREAGLLLNCRQRRAMTDGSAARAEEVSKRNRCLNLASPFVLESLGRPGDTARNFIGKYAVDKGAGESADAAAAWQSLSAIVQSESADLELRTCGWSPADRGDAQFVYLTSALAVAGAGWRPERSGLPFATERHLDRVSPQAMEFARSEHAREWPAQPCTVCDSPFHDAQSTRFCASFHTIDVACRGDANHGRWIVLTMSVTWLPKPDRPSDGMSSPYVPARAIAWHKRRLCGYLGSGERGGDSSAVQAQLQGDVQQIYSTDHAFAAVKSDGSVVTWGHAEHGGDSSAVQAQLQGDVQQIYSSRFVFAAVKSDGSVVTWGRAERGGDSSAVQAQLQGDVQQIYSTDHAFAAVKSDGSVVTWGYAEAGGDSSAVQAQLQGDVQQIYSSRLAFAAVKSDGSVVTWGHAGYGGDSSAVQAQLQGDVQQIYSNFGAFAAVKSDGSVVTWGYAEAGGDSSAVQAQLQGDVQQICSTDGAFAAVRSDGSVVTWGRAENGGDSSALQAQLQVDVQQIYSTGSAFAAVKSDGSVVTWGDPEDGGDSSALQAQLQVDVQQIYSNLYAFAAMKSDGSVVTWGDAEHGGDSSAVQAQLQGDVQQICSTEVAFAAVKSDGSVVTWGHAEHGGDSSAVQAQLITCAGASSKRSAARMIAVQVSLPSGATAELQVDRADHVSDLVAKARQAFGRHVVAICTRTGHRLEQVALVADLGLRHEDVLTAVVMKQMVIYAAQLGAFAALKSDGSVVTWGDAEYGGDSSAVQAQLQGDVQQIYSNLFAFAAVKSDGSVVTWGRAEHGGDSSAVQAQLQGDVQQICSTDYAFAAVKSDGSVVTWGEAEYGGDSSAVQAQLQGDVPQIYSTVYAFAAVKSDGSVVTWGVLNMEVTAPRCRRSCKAMCSRSTLLYAFAAVKSDGSVVTWGRAEHGGDSSAVQAQLQGDVQQICSTDYAFAAVKSDGSVVTWGEAEYGGDSSAVQAQLQGDVPQIYSTVYAFAAVKSDGSVVTWGRAEYGGDSSAVQAQLQGDVHQIYSNFGAFAVVKSDGSVVTWGDAEAGGDSSAVQAQLQGDVQQICSTDGAFAAVRSDGSVVTWGRAENGGDSSALQAQLQVDVQQIYANLYAFAAMKSDGSVVTWGDAEYGGDSSAVQAIACAGASSKRSAARMIAVQVSLPSGATAELQVDRADHVSDLVAKARQAFGRHVVAICTRTGHRLAQVALVADVGLRHEDVLTAVVMKQIVIYAARLGAFAALKGDGSVVTWGHAGYGGDSSAVQAQLQGDVPQIYSTVYAFAAVKSDGSLVTWGRAEYGGDSSAVQAQLQGDVHQIYSNFGAFAVVKSDGSVVTWGDAEAGGDSSAVQAQLQGDVQQICSTDGAFAAVRSDGSVVTWGRAENGGDSSALQAQLQVDVQQIYANLYAFAAMKSDGSVVTWGDAEYGGDSSAVQAIACAGASSKRSAARMIAVQVSLPSGATAELQVDRADHVSDLVAKARQAFGRHVVAICTRTGHRLAQVALVADVGLRHEDVLTAVVMKQIVIYAARLGAFAALKGDGSVVTWGHAGYGGDSSAVQAQLQGDVPQIYSTVYAFAAVKSDGSLVTWGRAEDGGDSSAVQAQLQGDVQQIYSNRYAFAVVKSDDSLVTWGHAGYGGDSSAVQAQQQGDVQQICSTDGAFAAVKSDGSVVTWGDAEHGGDSSAVQAQLQGDVQQIYSNLYAFAAVKSDGSVVTWGVAGYGGDSSAVQAQLQGDVQQIYSNFGAFAAVKSDGSLVTWGRAEDGGDSSAVQAQLQGDVQQIYSNFYAFAAVKSDGCVVTWGRAEDGGDSSAVQAQLQGDVQQIYSNFGAFAAVKSDGSVVTWGDAEAGGDSSVVQAQLQGDVQQIYSNLYAFAAVKSDGSVVTWGRAEHGGDSSAVQAQLQGDVQQICSTDHAFAAVKSDGSVVTWGRAERGGDSSAVQALLKQ
ncbi:unnamed protein product, partial [Polarella glacialis]